MKEQDLIDQLNETQKLISDKKERRLLSLSLVDLNNKLSKLKAELLSNFGKTFVGPIVKEEHNRRIKKISKYHFRVTYDGLEGFYLDFNFGPIIREYNLKGNFVLSHWQGAPNKLEQRHLRNFAYFSMRDGKTSYQVIPAAKMQSSIVPIAPIQIDDSEVLVTPTAVLLHRNCLLNESSIMKGEYFLSSY